MWLPSCVKFYPMSVNWACLSKNEKAFFANSPTLLSHVADLKIGGVAGNRRNVATNGSLTFSHHISKISVWQENFAGV